MASGMDITELLDELSEKLVGHTNWEFASPVNKVINADKIAEHIPSIIIYKDDIEEEEGG